MWLTSSAAPRHLVWADRNFEERRRGTMKFNEPEVLELGEARELIQETVIPLDEEGPAGFRTKLDGAIYTADE
jgi:hypothetical protein